MAVCLHCLHEERVAARERRQRAIIRFSLWTLGIAVVGAVGASAAGNAMKHGAPPRASRTAIKRPSTAPKRDSVIRVAAIPMPVIPQGSADTTRIVAHDTAVSPASQPVAVPTKPSDSTRTPAPAIPSVLALGRTDLPDSLFAIRTGDTVVVHFDTSPARTRRADKFERIVRQTLHAVYGPIADSVLASVPDGHLASPNDLLTDLPTRGIHLAAPNGHHIALWPETRPGRDGPLVVAYRTVIEQ